MKVVKRIEKEVTHCSECPYYYETQDMSVTLCCCELQGEGYDRVLGDVSWRNAHRKISEYCPLKNKEG